MLKSLRLTTAIAAFVTIVIAFPTAAAPEKVQPVSQKGIYMGAFGVGKTYARDIYLIPTTIQFRGNLRRFQTHNIYRQLQQVRSGYISGGAFYNQSINYEVVNCQDGTIDVQKSISFNEQGKQVNEMLLTPGPRIPEPGSASEKTLDFVCDYKK